MFTRTLLWSLSWTRQLKSYFSEIHLNITLPPSWWSLSFRLPNRNTHYTSIHLGCSMFSVWLIRYSSLPSFWELGIIPKQCYIFIVHPSYLFYLSIYLSICLSIHLSVCLWLYSPLLDLGRFFSFLIYTQSVGLLGRGISQPSGHYLHTGQHRHGINAHRHPRLEWDSNPRSQCSSRRKQFMP
jgi:hypothetical protein